MRSSLAMICALLIGGCAMDGRDKGEDNSVVVASTLPKGAANPEARWVDDFGAALEQGGMRPLLYRGGALGKEIERSEQTSLGLIDVNISSGDDVMTFSPLLRTLRLPFFIRTREQLDCMFAQPEFRSEVDDQTRQHGIAVADLIFMGSPAGLFMTGTAPTDARDLANRRIRAMDRMQVKVIAGWGASPVQVPWEEVQTALQTGIFEGYVNPPEIVRQFGHASMFESFVRMDVFMGFRFVVVSRDWLETLPTDERQTFEQALAEARRVNRTQTRSEELETLAFLREQGVKIVEPSASQITAFRESAIRATYDAVPADVLDRATRIRDERCSA